MKDEAIGGTGSILSWVLTITQTNEVFALIQIIFSTLVSIVTLAFILYKWYKKATDDNSDGGKKITKDEVEELGEDLRNFKDKENK